ncbi:MAG TPA: hypothetical protein VFL64_05420 [Rhizobacter sp.]|nr:hypothetical protein [Rhizobacter sp.]
MTAPRQDRPGWPPLIPSSRAPWLLRVRDLLLTGVAWLALIWELRKLLLELVGSVDPAAAARASRWLSEHLGPVLGRVQPPSAGFREDLLGYVYVACLLMLWLGLWGAWNRRRLLRKARAPGEAARQGDTQPPALLAGDQLTLGEVPQPELWHRAQRLRLSFDRDGRVTEVVDLAGGDTPTNRP